MSTPKPQQEKILASAIKILTNEGATALTVRNVATGADCSTTGVYTHFGGKQGLVDAIFMDGFESFDAAIYDSGTDLHDLGESYRRWALSRPTHYQVMFGSAVPEYKPSDEALVRAAASFDRLVARVAGGLDNASDDTEARSFAYHLWATVHGYVMLELIGMFPPDLLEPATLYSAGLKRIFDLRSLPQN